MYATTGTEFTVLGVDHILVHSCIPTWRYLAKLPPDNGLEICVRLSRGLYRLVCVKKLATTSFYPVRNGAALSMSIAPWHKCCYALQTIAGTIGAFNFPTLNLRSTMIMLVPLPVSAQTKSKYIAYRVSRSPSSTWVKWLVVKALNLTSSPIVIWSRTVGFVRTS